MKPKWLNASEMRAWLGYRRLRALLDLQITRDLASDSNLSDADYDVLSNLSETPQHRLRLNQLADHMLWSNSRLSHQLTRMEERGLVKREHTDSDGRGSVITLTPKGWRVIKAAAPLHVQSVRRNFIDLLSKEEATVLGDIADRVVAHLAAADGSGERQGSGGLSPPSVRESSPRRE
jgi:DNA-binding MarR family transcriptional regulator